MSFYSSRWREGMRTNRTRVYSIKWNEDWWIMNWTGLGWKLKVAHKPQDRRDGASAKPETGRLSCSRSSAISATLLSNFTLCQINDTLKQHIHQILTYNIWGSSSGTAEDLSILWCDTVSLSDKFSESWRITVPSPSGSSSPKRIFFFNCHVTSAAVLVKPWILRCRISYAHVPYCWGGLQTRAGSEHQHYNS